MEEEVAWVKGIGFKWAKLPKRCISRETSLESYVRPVEPCEKKKGQEPSVELAEIKT